MLPKIDLEISQPDKRDKGLILLTIGRNTRSIRKTSEFEAIIAIDRHGEIVWHKTFDFCLMDCRQSRQNTLLVMGTDGRALEIGFDGELIHQWYCTPRFPDGLDGIPLETEKIHHTICELADGLLASLSIHHHPLAEPHDGWTHLMSDTVVIFDRAGRIEQEFSLVDCLDTERMSHDGPAPYWANQGWLNTLDWTHGNCLIEDPKDGGLLLSLRHQDAVVKVTRRGELVWILGDSTGWRTPWQNKLLRLQGGRPFYHQHDLSFTAAGHLMLFDNGTAGSFPPNPRQPLALRQSFALTYEIDEILMTAKETWRYGGEGFPYSHYVSGVCEMPNGNRFIACTGIRHDLSGERVEIPPQGVGHIELFEVTLQNECVFHAMIDDPGAIPEAGWNGFRPEYLAPLVAQQLR